MPSSKPRSTPKPSKTAEPDTKCRIVKSAPEPSKTVKPKAKRSIIMRRHPSRKQNLEHHHKLYRISAERTRNHRGPLQLDDFTPLLLEKPRVLEEKPQGSPGQERYDRADVAALLARISSFCAANPNPSYDGMFELVRMLLCVPKELRLSHSSRETFEEAAAPWVDESETRECLESLADLERTIVAKLLFGGRVDYLVEKEGGRAIV